MPKLKNTLVDACVVIGVNNDTELIHLSGGPQIGGDNTEKYKKYGPYKQHVLGVCTESVAFFPEATTRVEGEPFYEETEVICPNAVQLEEGATPRTPTVRRSISYKPEAKRVLPFSNEVISSLPTFCFPNGGYIYKERQKPVVNNLVLTNMEGLRMYAVSITYSCPFMVAESVKEKGKCKVASSTSPDDVFGNENSSVLSQVYIPICVCLVSLHPFLNTMKECLSALLPQVEGVQVPDEFWRPIMKLTTVVTTIPVPPPGPLAIEFRLFGCSHVIHPADEAGRRVIDIDLQLPLLIFKPEVIVEIITCFLTQQRIVFMCSTYPLLTLIIEAFFTYIDPIRWRLTYVPVLPNTLGDLLEAPGPFIMGVHSDLRNQVKQIRKQPETPSIVLVDIDKGIIDIDDKTVIPKMPNIVSQSLLVRLRKASPSHQIQLATAINKFTYEEVEEQRRSLFEQTKAELKDIFLDMLVSLFGDIYNHMTAGERYFDKNSYLQSRHDDERSFFMEVLNTDAFERFVDERLDNQQRRDAFAVLGERIAAQRKATTRSRSSSIIQALKMSTTLSPIFKEVTERFSIPMSLEESLTSGNFYRVYCDSLTKKLDALDSKAISLKASYLYLRGFARIACNYPIEGLRDFHSLYASAPELTPSDYIYEVVSMMDPGTLDALEKEQFYKQTHMIRTFTNKESDRKRNPSRKLPNEPLSKTDFEKRAKTYKISSSPELTDWLFSVLSDQGDTVCPDSFHTLYKVCMDIEKHSENREVAGVTINTVDAILKVSPLISSMIGMGRLVLSTNRLFFVKDGGREYSLVTQLIDIKELIKYQHHSVFFTGVQAIRIINSDRNIPPFYASLKDDRDLWFLFLSEMSNAHKSAEAMRDPKMVDTAKNNVLVASALLEMQYPLKTIEGACLFAKRKATTNSKERLSEETREALEMRLDPCVRETKRTTVMSIAYVPGNTSINECGYVWCGMGSGAIMVYETNRWNCVSELRYAKNRISCLSLIGNNQIWAGSFDSVIYVINTETRNSEQQLQNHTDFVSHIISQEKSDSKTVAWSSSFNGQVVCWDPETREAINSFTLKNKVRTLSQIIFVGDSNLWCVTSDKIIIVDVSQKDFPIIQKLIVYDEYEMPTLIEYALKVTEDEIWVGSKTQGGGLTIWDTKTCKSTEVKLDERVKICSMISLAESVWVGNKDGKVFIMDRDRKVVERELHAHTDLVRSMCVTSEGHVITGSSSKEGKICVWNVMFGFDVIDARKKLAPGYEFIEKSALPEPVPHY